MKKILYRWENQREDRKKRKSLKIILGKKSFSVCWSLPKSRHYPVGLDKCLKLLISLAQQGN